MSEFVFKTSDDVDTDINRMARQLGINTSNATLMTNAVLKRALNLCKYVLDEKSNGSRVLIENHRYDTRKEIYEI